MYKVVYSTKELSLATNSNVLILISWQPDGVDFYYFKLLDPTEFKV